MILRPVRPASAWGPSDLEAAGGIDEKLRVAVEVPGRHDLPYDTVDDVPLEIVVRDLGVVLGRNHHVADPVRPAVLVLDADLGLRIGAEEPGERNLPGFPDLGQVGHEIVGELDGERHELVGLVARVAEHHPLIARALFLVEPLAFGDPLRNVGRLAHQFHEDSAGVAVEALVRMVVTDVERHPARHAHVIHLALAGDLPRDDDQVVLDQGLARHPAVGVLGQVGVEHRIRDLIAHLVGMSLRNRLRGENKVFVRHG